MRYLRIPQLVHMDAEPNLQCSHLTQKSDNSDSQERQSAACSQVTVLPLIPSKSVKLRLNFQQEEHFAWDACVWDPMQIAVAFDEQVADLHGLLRVEVLHRAISDGTLRKKLSSGTYAISVAVSIRPRSCNWGAMALHEVTRMFDRVSDLLEEPQRPPHFLDATITMVLKRCKKRAAGIIRDAVLIQGGVRQYEYFKLGDVPIPQGPGNEALILPWTRKGRRARRQEEIRYVWALLAWRDPKSGHWQLSRVHGYDFDDFCIGDCDEWTTWNKVKFDSQHDYALPYQTVSRHDETFQQLQVRIEEHIAGNFFEPASGVPFLPTYTCNVYRPESYGLGVQIWPKYDIDVAVRCVNHLDYTTELKGLALPQDIRLEIEKHDTMDDIRAIIVCRLNRNDRQFGVKVNSSILFEGRHAGKWEIDLWAMPQQPGPRKLFRYWESKLTQFLSISPKVRKKDKRLYMEAHIVPRR
ncbi:hypothetical protein LTR85_009178 [Meristemomyces frigidus]|nr:hypothetical protein LTR85_009178 [Meristemomyces frigidus]